MKKNKIKNDLGQKIFMVFHRKALVIVPKRRNANPLFLMAHQSMYRKYY